MEKNKTNNVAAFCQDIANAIMEKKGSTEPINAQDFSIEIRNLPSGGGVQKFKPIMHDDTGRGIQQITHVTIAEGTIKIDDYAYYYCRGLQSALIPEGIETVGSDAFAYCSSLESVVLPSSVKYIGQRVFTQSMALQSCTIPIDAPVQVLSYNMFWKNNLLKKFIVPKNVNTVAAYAFEACGGLVYIDFSNVLAVPTLDNANAFSTASGVIIVPDALYDQWITATNWASLADRIVKDSEYTRPL
jgi:hypothetical protein